MTDITIKQAAEILGLAETTVNRHCADGWLPSRTVTQGRRRRLLNKKDVLKHKEKLSAKARTVWTEPEPQPLKTKPVVRPSVNVTFIRDKYPEHVKAENDRLFHERLAAFKASGRRPLVVDRQVRVVE